MNIEKMETKNNELADQRLSSSTITATRIDKDGFVTLEKENYKASIEELILALVLFICAYIYTETTGINIAIMFLTVVLGTESLNRSHRINSESIIILSCFSAATLSFVLWDLGVAAETLFRVFEGRQLYYIIHIFAVWYVLTRSGKLVGGENSRYLPMDILNGFVIVPFSNFFGRFKCISFALKQRNPEEKKGNGIYIILAAVLCIALFLYAGNLLGNSDEVFGKIVEKVKDTIDFEISFETLFRLVISLPIGAYLFGLISGSARMNPEKLELQKRKIDGFMGSIKKVPVKFFTTVIIAFSAMYVLYFGIQSSYLFGAFVGKLPEGFIPSQYAREGFFELLRVIAINFAVVYLSTRMNLDSDDNGLIKIAAIALLAESLVFAAIAISKLAFYVSIFGFTPKRVLSIWMASVLLSGCILWILSLLKNKEYFKYWLYYGAISLAMVCVY